MQAKRSKGTPACAQFQDKIHQPTLVQGSQDELAPVSPLFFILPRNSSRDRPCGAAHLKVR
jgi:hypothetical protein